MIPLQLFAVLIVGAGANCVIQSFAMLLRSFKSEPFLVPVAGRRVTDPDACFTDRDQLGKWRRRL